MPNCILGVLESHIYPATNTDWSVSAATIFVGSQDSVIQLITFYWREGWAHHLSTIIYIIICHVASKYDIVNNIRETQVNKKQKPKLTFPSTDLHLN